MSCNVLIILEDFRYDRHITAPLTSAIMAAAGRPRAKVRVLTDPLLGGTGQALRLERLQEIVDRNPLVDLFLLLVDRDGDPNRRAALDAREQEIAERLPQGAAFIAQEAWQEIETWGLASLASLPRAWTWSEVRAEPHPKEVYFHPYTKSLGTSDRLGGGRRELGREVARNYNRVRQRSPEIANLEARIAAWIQGD